MRRDPPETRWLLATNEEDGRAPGIAAGAGLCRLRQSFNLRRGFCSDLDPIRHHAGLDVRQSAIKSFLAIATMAFRRVRPCSVPTRSRNHIASALSGW